MYKKKRQLNKCFLHAIGKEANIFAIFKKSRFRTILKLLKKKVVERHLLY